MLVLSRKKSESIVIDNRITIRVVEIRGNRVRLAFDAPSDVIIRRAELCSPPSEPKTVPVKTVPPPAPAVGLQQLLRRVRSHLNAAEVQSTERYIEYHHHGEASDEGVRCEVDIAGCV